MMTEEERGAWLALRAGKLTASRMNDAMAFTKKLESMAARNDYLRELLAERICDHSARHFVSEAMRHGIAYEDEAKIAYEAATGNLLTDPRTAADLGFFSHPRIENFGASPDSLLGKHGLLEVKCPTTPKFVAWKLAGVVPEEHQKQMIAQLACTGRRYCVFCAYEPRIREVDRRLFILRFEPTREQITEVETAAIAFLETLDEMFSQFVGAPA